MPFNKGDQVFIDTNQLTNKEIIVKWQQNLSNRSQQYYCVPIQGGGQDSMIFVQKSYLDNFKSKISGGLFISGSGTFTVDDSFQYGQRDSSGTGRWLVFHDKDQKMFQWRYIEGVVSKLGNAGTDLLKKVNLPTDIDVLRNSLGDYLRFY